MFPSLTICNLNQVEASFLRENDAYGNITNTNILLDEFIRGRKGNISKEDESFVNELKEKIGMNSGWNLLERSRQTCTNLFISISFREMHLTWKKINEETLGPILYPTDFGSCCLLVPHLDLKEITSNLSVGQLYHSLKADTLNGEMNGVDIILDAEQFNYAFYHSNAAGFKIAMHHHLDKPMIQFSSQLLFTGTETQINLKPIISNTTEEAIYKFDPEDRGCYTQHEQNLTYLRYEDGFRYEMNNCLIDEGIRDIIWNCRCMPSFGYVPEYLEFIPVCSGEKLLCANTRMKSLGMPMVSFANSVTVPEARQNPNMIGNISKPDSIKCRPACEVQENKNQMSFAPYPQRGNFFYQKTFCNLASHIWQETCQKENRAYFMTKDQPNLCPVLKDFDGYFGKSGIKLKNSSVRTSNNTFS